MLIVDDAPALRDVLAHFVARLGHEVVGHAADAGAALEIAGAMHPDAVAVDGRLPHGAALPLIAALRAALPQARLLIVASLDELALVRAARDAGADGALARPFLPSQVAQALAD